MRERVIALESLGKVNKMLIVLTELTCRTYANTGTAPSQEYTSNQSEAGYSDGCLSLTTNFKFIIEGGGIYLFAVITGTLSRRQQIIALNHFLLNFKSFGPNI